MPGQHNARIVLLAITAGLTAFEHLEAAPNVVIWDTGARLSDTADGISRTDWKAVPSELFAFEAEPLKAASDPGYYGQEYSFKGDAVVENQSLTAVFWSAKGSVVLYSKGNGAQDKAGFGNKVAEFIPLRSTSPGAKISRCEIMRNACDEAVIQAVFEGSSNASAAFSFGRDQIVEIKPAAGTKGLSLRSPIAYGVVPGFVGDDLIFGPAEFASAERLSIPAENVFLGLLKGESTALVMTWPKGKQHLNLKLAGDSKGTRIVESVDFENDGQSFYVSTVNAPGIWHREELKPAYLEKDVPLTWKKPFPAKWKTQLSEAGVRTTFAFREAKGTVWRGVPGSYNYPAWFEGDKAFFSLSKKVPPKGEALIYFIEGQNTPTSFSTPVDILKSTLGRQASELIIDAAGQKLRTHHRRGGDGVHRSCTCGCTEAIQAIIEAGMEVEKKDEIKEALADMNYFVERHVERIEEYRKFAAEMLPLLKAKQAAAPELKPFLESLEQIVQQIPQEYDVQKENMKSPAHAADLTRQTLALTESKSPNNLKTYMELLKAWRAMGGAQDYVVAQCHNIARRLFQEAGYGCVNDPNAVPLAMEIRALCRQVLRNPDGYEIWANY